VSLHLLLTVQLERERGRPAMDVRDEIRPPELSGEGEHLGGSLHQGFAPSGTPRAALLDDQSLK